MTANVIWPGTDSTPWSLYRSSVGRGTTASDPRFSLSCCLLWSSSQKRALCVLAGLPARVAEVLVGPREG